MFFANQSTELAKNGWNAENWSKINVEKWMNTKKSSIKSFLKKLKNWYKYIKVVCKKLMKNLKNSLKIAKKWQKCVQMSKIDQKSQKKCWNRMENWLKTVKKFRK